LVTSLQEVKIRETNVLVDLIHDRVADQAVFLNSLGQAITRHGIHWMLGSHVRKASISHPSLQGKSWLCLSKRGGGGFAASAIARLPIAASTEEERQEGEISSSGRTRECES
jgi:hypothetical protein